MLSDKFYICTTSDVLKNKVICHLGLCGWGMEDLPVYLISNLNILKHRVTEGNESKIEF